MNRYPCNGFVGTLILLISVCGLSADAVGAKPVYRVPDEKVTLDGTADYKVIPYDPAMALPAKSGKITVAAWVRTNSASRPQMVLKREGAVPLSRRGKAQSRTCVV